MKRNKFFRSLSAPAAPIKFHTVVSVCNLVSLFVFVFSISCGKRSYPFVAKPRGAAGAKQQNIPVAKSIANINPLDKHSLAAVVPESNDGSSDAGIDEVKESIGLQCEESRPEVKGGLRALTRFQYKASLEALLPPSVLTAPAVANRLKAFPSDHAPKKFDSQVFELPRQVALEAFEIGGEIGLVLASNNASRGEFWAMHGISCQATAAQPAGMRDCVTNAVDGLFVKRAWRRPASAAERTRLLSMYDSLAPQSQVAALGSVIAAVLQREDFLFRIEGAPTEGTRTVLTPYELAARLSFGITGRVPDALLIAEVDAGRLVSSEQIQSQAKRLMDLPEARANFRNFARQWLNLNNVLIPSDAGFAASQGGANFTEAAAGEVAQIFESILFDAGGSFASLFTTRLAKPTHPFLASAYGVPESSTLVTLPEGNRNGILTRMGVLSGNLAAPSTPHRGYNARVNLLCGKIGSIPAGLDLSPPPNAPDVESGRKGWERSHARGACVSCHSQMNPLGFVMEGYDGHGKFRDKETVLRRSSKEPVEVPIDTNVVVDIVAGESISASSLVDFQAKIGENALAQACFMGRLFVYTKGSMDGPNCVVKEMHSANLAAASQGGLRAAVLQYFLGPELKYVVK